MGIFKKHKVEDEETKNLSTSLRTREGFDENGKERKVKVKKIKDLNSENKKKRKEPIRAWNKIDRIVLFLIIIVTSGWSFYFAASSKGWKMPVLPHIDLSAFNLFGTKTVILESGGKDRTKIDKALSEFSYVTKDLTGKYGLYITVLDDNLESGLYEDDIFQAASLIKLPVMVGMYMAEEDGSLSLSSSHKLKAEDKIRGSGSLYAKPAGYEISYRELIKLMGKESDNTAYNICVKILGKERIGEIIGEIGMKDTSLETNKTTPNDIGLFFRKLWNRELLNVKNTDELLSFMTDTSYEEHLAAGVPNNVRIAHKYGRETGVVNDAGIVYTEDPYIVVIMSKEVNLLEADRVFPDLSKTIYNSLSK